MTNTITFDNWVAIFDELLHFKDITPQDIGMFCLINKTCKEVHERKYIIHKKSLGTLYDNTCYSLIAVEGAKSNNIMEVQIAIREGVSTGKNKVYKLMYRVGNEGVKLFLKDRIQKYKILYNNSYNCEKRCTFNYCMLKRKCPYYTKNKHNVMKEIAKKGDIEKWKMNDLDITMTRVPHRKLFYAALKGGSLVIIQDVLKIRPIDTDDMTKMLMKIGNLSVIKNYPCDKNVCLSLSILYGHKHLFEYFLDKGAILGPEYYPKIFKTPYHGFFYLLEKRGYAVYR